MTSPESRRIENILASISDCFYALDAECRFIYLNPQAEEYFGCTRQELMGRNVWEVFPDARGTLFEREFLRVMEEGGSSRFETVSVATGRTVEMTIYAQPKDPAIVDGGGGLAIYFRDVTEVREAEKQHRERADYYRLLVENAREYAIIGLDLDGCITHWNEGARRIFGWRDEEVVGKSSDLLFLPEDIQNAIPEKERAEAARTGRGNDERIHLRADGSTFWAIGDSMALYEEDGALRGFLKILRDNTERREAEDEFRRVQATLQQTENWLRRVSNQVGVAFWIWEPDQDRITYQNRLDAMFGIYFESFQRFGELLHPGDRDYVNVVVGRALTLIEDYEMEFRVRRHEAARPENDADWKWILCVVSVQKREDGSKVCFGINLDVTARKQVQLQFDQSQRRLQEVARAARVAIWAWNPLQDILHEKFMLDELFGFEVKNFAQFATILHPTDVATTIECAHRVVESGVRLEVHYRLPAVSQPDPNRVEDWRHFLCKMSPGNRDETEAMIYGMTIDVTEQRLAQEGIERSERRYAALAEATETNVWSARADLSELDMPGWENLTGQTPEDFQNGGWVEAIHPTDRDRVAATWEHALASSEGFEITYLLRHKDGRYRYNTGRALPVLDANGTLVEWIGTNVNTDEIITAQHALRDSERRYRALIDAAPQIVWESVPDGQMVYGNEFWLRYCGLSPHEVLGNSWKKCVHPDDLSLMETDWETARRKKFLYEREVRLWCAPKKEWRWHLTRALPIIDERGEIEKWIGAAIEIHERRLADELREQLLQEEQKARRSAEIASRQKEEFLAIVSHELRTPLNAILGWSNLLRTGELPPQTQMEGLQVIERNARAQAQIVDDILDVARVIAGKLKVEKRAFDLAELGRETLESLAPSADARDVTLHGEYASLPIVGDPIRLRQVLWNLLSNAIKFTPEGGDVYLAVRPHNGRAIIEVRDTGAGIDAEFLPHVFDRFRQADSSSTRRHGGLGLGLALVSSIVEAHGGQVCAQSAGIGGGATFTVTLPLGDHKGARPLAPSGPTTERRLEKCTVLIVDDAPDTLALTSLLLRREGATVETANSVAEAQERILARHFDLVISDLAMPEADGYELLEWLRDTENQVPVVAVTAFASGEEERRVRAAGFNGFVPKPIDSERLIYALQKVLVRA